MVMCNTNAAGYDMRRSVILLLKSAEILSMSNQQYCALQAAEKYLSVMFISFSFHFYLFRHGSLVSP